MPSNWTPERHAAARKRLSHSPMVAYELAACATDLPLALDRIEALEAALREILSLTVPMGSDYGNADVVRVVRKALNA